MIEIIQESGEMIPIEIALGGLGSRGEQGVQGIQGVAGSEQNYDAVVASLAAMTKQVIDSGTDLAKLQNAIDNTPTNGKLTLKQGAIYTISGTLNLKSNIRIDGNNATITQTLARTPLMLGTNLVNVEINKLNLMGVGTDYTQAYDGYNLAMGIRIMTGTNVEINNCKLNNFGVSGIYFEIVKNFLIESCEIIGTGSPIISGDKLLDIHQMGVYMGNGCDNGLVHHNKISEMCVGIYQSHDNPNMIYDSNLIFDIRGQHGFYIADFDGLVISNNIIKNVNNTGIKFQIDLASTKQSRNVQIIGNTIDGFYCAIIMGDNSTEHVYRFNNVTIEGNNCITAMPLCDDGIKLDRVTNGIITGNHVEGARHGISITSCDGFIISNNKITNVYQYAFFLRTPFSQNIVFKGNVIKNCLTGMYFDNGTNIFIEDNLVEDISALMTYSLFMLDVTNGQFRNNRFLNATVRFNNPTLFVPSLWDKNDVFSYYGGSYNTTIMLGQKSKIYHGTRAIAPTTNAGYIIGSKYEFTDPIAGGYVGKILVGTTWKDYGLIVV